MVSDKPLHQAVTILVNEITAVRSENESAERQQPARARVATAFTAQDAGDCRPMVGVIPRGRPDNCEGAGQDIDMILAHATVPKGDTDSQPFIAARFFDGVGPAQLANLSQGDEGLGVLDLALLLHEGI